MNCEVLVELNPDGLKSTEEAFKLFNQYIDDLSPLHANIVSHPIENGYKFDIEFTCSGENSCLVAKLRELNILNKAKINGTCPKVNTSKSELQPV